MGCRIMKHNISVKKIFLNEKQLILDLSKKRLITKYAVSVFNEMLNCEYWDNIVNHTDVNES